MDGPGSEQGISLPQVNGKNVGRKPQLQDRLLLVAGLGHPSGYSKSLKWYITIMLAAAAFIDPTSYTILYPALPQLPTQLHTTQAVANLSSTLSSIGPAITPLYWSFLAERKGRRIVMLIFLAFFAIFSALSAAATSIGMLMATRFLGSFFSGAGSVAGAAIVADIWPSEVLGFAMSIFYLGPLLGTVLGPVIGGILTQVWGWRSVQWFLTGYAGLILLLVTLFLRETLEPEDHAASQEERSIENESVVDRTVRLLTIWIASPLKSVKYLQYPAAAVVIASVCFAAVQMSAMTIQETFHGSPYNFSYLVVGLLYIPFAIGVNVGGLLSGKWSDHIAYKAAQADQTHNQCEFSTYAPESRLRENAWISVSLLPGALLIYGWTIQMNIFWVVPIIAWAITGFSTGLMFSLVTTILTEINPAKSATLVALNALGRNLFSTVSGSITQPLAATIGNGWEYTGMAIFTLINVLAVFIFQRHGRRWREHSDERMGVIRNTGVQRGIPLDDTKEASKTGTSMPAVENDEEQI